MILVKKIGIRFLAIAITIIAFNSIYSTIFSEKDIQQHSDIINLVRNVQDTSEILYFGESSNFSYRNDDIDKRTISKMIASYYPEKKLGTISKGALHAGIYKILLQNIPDKNNIETIIITLNLRSFNADWIYSNLETALQKSVVLLKNYPPIINRIILSFKGYDIKTDNERQQQLIKCWKNEILIFPYQFKYKNVSEWDKALANGSYLKEDGSWDMPKIELSCHYVKSYAFQINENKNPRIKDFDDIVKIAKKRNWQLVFNLMAENVEKADSLIGKELIYLINQNKKLLIERYAKNGVIVVDNLDNIANEQYIDQNWTTEHYAQKGRMTIAKNCADSLKIIYPNTTYRISSKNATHQ